MHIGEGRVDFAFWMATSWYLALKKWDVPAWMTLLTDLLTFVSVGARFLGETTLCFNSPVLILQEVWEQNCAFSPEIWSRCSVPGKKTLEAKWCVSVIGGVLWCVLSCPLRINISELSTPRFGHPTSCGSWFMYLCMYVCESCSIVSDSASTWTTACQAPLFVRFSRQEY